VLLQQIDVTQVTFGPMEGGGGVEKAQAFDPAQEGFGGWPTGCWRLQCGRTWLVESGWCRRLRQGRTGRADADWIGSNPRVFTALVAW